MANELRQLVDTANAPIFGIDVNGNVNEWNEKTAEVTGFSKEEAFHKPLVSTFIVPKLRQSVQDVLENALRGNETSNYELEFRTKSNEIRYLLVNATTRRDADYNIVGVVGVAQVSCFLSHWLVALIGSISKVSWHFSGYLGRLFITAHILFYS
jgi:PAS domain S-box-containing protein